MLLRQRGGRLYRELAADYGISPTRANQIVWGGRRRAWKQLAEARRLLGLEYLYRKEPG